MSEHREASDAEYFVSASAMTRKVRELRGLDVEMMSVHISTQLFESAIAEEMPE